MPQTKAKILVIEDDAQWRTRLQSILLDTGDYEVTTADSYDAAMKALEASEYDAALVDLRLVDYDSGNMQGLDVLEELARHPGTATILVTGYATAEIVKECYEVHRVSTVIFKDKATPVDFRDAVHRALGSSRAGKRESGESRQAKRFAEEGTMARDAGAVDTKSHYGLGRVLVVEDESNWQDRLVGLITETGLEPVLEAQYVPALARLSQEEFVLAVVDLSLDRFDRKNFDGLNVLMACKQLGVPTIVVSGVMTFDLAQKVFREYGVRMGLEKRTFDVARFRAEVQRAADPGTPRIPSRHPPPEVSAEIRESVKRQFLLEFCALRDFVLNEYARAKQQIDEAGKARLTLGTQHYEVDERWWRENVTKLDVGINEIWRRMSEIHDLNGLREAEGEIQDRCVRWPVWWQES